MYFNDDEEEEEMEEDTVKLATSLALRNVKSLVLRYS